MAGSEQRATPSSERKTERIEVRVTPSVKKVIQRAAAVSGLTPGDLAFEGARRLLETHEAMELSEARSRAFAQALVDAPESVRARVEALQRRTARPKMTREEAIAIVDAGIGSRPDLPPSEQVVREIRDRLYGGGSAPSDGSLD